MNDSRIVAFGCSNTFGQGLEDCWNSNESKPGTEPSKFSWPFHLAKKLNFKCINLANPGSSNLEILYRILTFDFKLNDIAVILWTNELRSCLFQESDNKLGVDVIQLGIWQNYNKADIQSWLKVNSDFNLKIQTHFHIHHAEQYLENKKIKNYSFFSNGNCFDTLNFLKINNGINQHLHPYIFDLDKALDNGHPGPLAHESIADFMHKHMVNKCY